MTRDAAKEQNRPEGRGREVLPLVVEDLEARAEAGEEKYGERLRAHNGRDALLDAYQEALDLSMYLRQALEEKSGTGAVPVGFEPEPEPEAICAHTDCLENPLALEVTMRKQVHKDACCECCGVVLRKGAFAEWELQSGIGPFCSSACLEREQGRKPERFLKSEIAQLRARVTALELREEKREAEGE